MNSKIAGTDISVLVDALQQLEALRYVRGTKLGCCLKIMLSDTLTFLLLLSYLNYHPRIYEHGMFISLQSVISLLIHIVDTFRREVNGSDIAYIDIYSTANHHG